MGRRAAILLFACFHALGCQDPAATVGYCDSAGCFGCSDHTYRSCWALPYAPCSAATECAAGETCTTVGCSAPCQGDGECRAGESCAEGGYCAPKSVAAVPVGAAEPPGGSPGGGAVACGIPKSLCRSDTQCGAGRVCTLGACRAACGAQSPCPVGQACTSGACVDVTPAQAECLWDADCGTGARCINAACHSPCTGDGQCERGEFCDARVCRADARPLANR